MRRAFVLLCSFAFCLSFLLIASTHADTFGTGENQFEIEFVTIGDPGNPADTADSTHRLNITLDEGGPEKPATRISWFEAARFVGLPEPASLSILLCCIALVGRNRGCPIAGRMFIVATSLCCLPPNAIAETILFESATLGPTGISTPEVFDQQTVPASNVDTASFQGIRFSVDQTWNTTQVGGHFVIGPSTENAFFGAIVTLDDGNDFPDSSDLSTGDVLGVTTLRFPADSNEVYGDIDLTLSPGWYALIFGAGLFGTNGDGAILRNNSDIGSPDYIGFAAGFGWGNRLPDKYLAIKGEVIPEPTAISLVFSALLLATITRRPHRK